MNLYSPLRKDEIRLVTIISRSPLQLQQRVVSLESCPPYTSLSYVWGSGKSRDIDFCLAYQEFHRLSFTIDLRRALRRLSGHTDWFWIDTICIDQCDLDERSSQVPLMRTIYTQNKDVIVYLGQVIEPRFASPGITGSPSGISTSIAHMLRGRTHLKVLTFSASSSYWAAISIASCVPSPA